MYSFSMTCRIAVIGQAPVRQALTSGIPWDDASKKLTEWLGVTEEQFRDPSLLALMPDI